MHPDSVPPVQLPENLMPTLVVGAVGLMLLNINPFQLTSPPFTTPWNSMAESAPPSEKGILPGLPATGYYLTAAGKKALKPQAVPSEVVAAVAMIDSPVGASHIR
jgi:hypothetical protein